VIFKYYLWMARRVDLFGHGQRVVERKT